MKPLAALAAAAAVPLLIFAVVVVALFGRQQQQAMEDLLLQHARVIVQTVDRYLAADLKALHALSHATPADAPRGFFLELRRVIEADPHWLMVRLNKVPGGDTLAAAERDGFWATTPDPLVGSPLEDVLRRGARIGNLETLDAPQQHQFVRLTVPVVRDGQPHAILSAFVSARIFSQALREAKVPAEWTASILDRNDVIVGRSRSPEAFVGMPASDTLRRTIAAGTSQFSYNRNKEGDLVYTAIYRSPLSGWIAAVGVPAAVADAPLQRTMIAIGAGGLLALILAAAIGWAMARNFASREAAEKRLAALAEARATERRLTDIAANLPGAIIRRVLHPDGTVTYPYVSDRIAEVMGMTLEDARSADSMRAWAPYVHPDDRVHWQRQVMESARTMQRYRFDARVVGEGGAIRWVRSIGHPRRQADGSIIWDGVILDVTDTKKAEQRQELLLQELSHRVKNTLAVVSSIARRTMAQTRSVETFSQAFDGRLQALGRAHTLLTRSRWEGSDLREVVEAAIGPFRRGQGSTFTVEGPATEVEPRIAITLSLVLHELATNATKYGALSVAAGRIAIRWEIDDSGHLEIVWQESDGPAVQPPERTGFGSTLITRSVTHELGGTATLDYRTEGVVCRIRVTLGSDEPVPPEPDATDPDQADRREPPPPGHTPIAGSLARSDGAA